MHNARTLLRSNWRLLAESALTTVATEAGAHSSLEAALRMVTFDRPLGVLSSSPTITSSSMISVLESTWSGSDLRTRSCSEYLCSRLLSWRCSQTLFAWKSGLDQFHRSFRVSDFDD
jgi:hypothetical protein